MDTMKELVSPEQAEFYVNVMASILTFLAAIAGWRAVGSRGLLAGLCGPLMWAMWQVHKYLTRYDPRTGYFGLDKVKVLFLELAMFVALGVIMGAVWNFIARPKGAKT